MKNDSNKKLAFTLAEVLITLGIIGVVSAITIPTLVKNYQKKVVPTRIKKAYAELVQVIQLSQVENGPMNSWEFGNEGGVENTQNVLSKYILPYYKGIKKCSTGLDYSCGLPASKHGINYRLNNGLGISFVVIDGYSIYCTISFKFGTKLISGKDWFYFTISDGKVLPFGWFDGLTRENILSGFDYVNSVGSKFLVDCAKEKLEEIPEGYYGYSYREGCTALLFIDNWQIKDDYPW